MTPVDDDKFWRDLRSRLEPDRDAVERAEARLRADGAPDADDSPPPDPRWVDDTLRRAGIPTRSTMAGPAAPRATPPDERAPADLQREPAERDAPVQERGRTVRFRRLRRWWIAAAASAILVPAIAWKGVTLIWPEGHNSQTTLDYDQAVGLMLQTSQPRRNREVAMGRFNQRIRLAIGDLIAVAQDPRPEVAPLAERAAAHRAALLERLSDSKPTDMAVPPDEWEHLRAVVRDESQPLARRIEAVDRLDELLESGIHLLLTMDTNDLTFDIKRKAVVVLLQLQLDPSRNGR